MRNQWRRWSDKQGTQWTSPSFNCPFSIKIGALGNKHIVYDVRLYAKGGMTAYAFIGESLNIAEAQKILRLAWRKEQ